MIARKSVTGGCSTPHHLSDALCHEVTEQGTTVLSFHMGQVRTALGDSFGDPDASPIPVNTTEAVVTAVLDAIEAGSSEVLIDEMSRVVRSTIDSDPTRYAAIVGG